VVARGKRSTLAVLAAGLALAQLAACGSCVKDDPSSQTDPASSTDRRKRDLGTMAKPFMPVSEAGKLADASTTD